MVSLSNKVPTFRCSCCSPVAVLFPYLSVCSVRLYVSLCQGVCLPWYVLFIFGFVSFWVSHLLIRIRVRGREDDAFVFLILNQQQLEIFICMCRWVIFELFLASTYLDDQQTPEPYPLPIDY